MHFTVPVSFLTGSSTADALSQQLQTVKWIKRYDVRNKGYHKTFQVQSVQRQIDRGFS